jgi:hypothetical protein
LSLAKCRWQFAALMDINHAHQTMAPSEQHARFTPKSGHR